MSTKAATRKNDWFPFLFGAASVLLGTAAGLLAANVPNPLWILAIVAGVIAVVATIFQVEWGLLAVVFISYTNLSDVLIRNHHVPSILQPFMGLLILAILARWILYSETPRGWLRTAVLASVYGLVALASMLWAQDVASAQQGVIDYAKDAIIAVIITILLRRGPVFRGVVWVLLASGIFLGTLAVFQQLTHTFGNDYGGFALAPVQNIIGDVNLPRVAGSIGDPNFFGQILIVLVPLALDRLWHEKSPWLRLMALWALGATTLSIFFTFSRGAFIGLVIVLAVMFIRRPPKFITFLATLAIVIGALQFISAQYFDRLGTLSDIVPGFGDPLQEISLRGRLSENTVAWMMFMDHPILGVGLDNYPALYQGYSRELGIDPRTAERQPHNLYLEIASQLGIVGLVVFAVILFYLFRSLYRAQRTFLAGGLNDYADLTMAFSVGVVGYMTSSLFLHAAYGRYFWLLFGIGMALPQVARYELRVRGQAMAKQVPSDGSRLNEQPEAA